MERSRQLAAILPVSEREVPAQFGLRHALADGKMSEATDAIGPVVSEETWALSMTKNGKILHNMSPFFKKFRDTINEYLNNRLDDRDSEDISGSQFQKKRKTGND